MRILHTPEANFDPSADCVIFKSVFTADECENAANFIEDFISDPNHKDRSFPNHWSQNVGERSALKSATFQRPEPPLIPFFERLFELYRPQIGTSLSMADYMKQSPKEIAPTVFIYDCGFGKLERHRHQSKQQKSQFLLNLTRPGVDYSGGETEIEMPDGSVEAFGSDFQQGDIFSFPYHLFHRVNSVGQANGGRGKRISLLMPIFDLSKGKNVYES